MELESKIKQNWEKNPFLLKQAHDIHYNDIFKIIAERGMVSSDDSDLNAAIQYIDNNKILNESISLLPSNVDLNVQDYANRIQQEYKCQSFSLTLPALQRYSIRLWQKLLNNHKYESKINGIPSNYADINLILGNDEVSPIGLHKKAASTYSYIIHGKKTTLVWPLDYFSQYAKSKNLQYQYVNINSSVDYRDHINNATILTAQQGDIVYIPSSCWHISISNGDTHLCINYLQYLNNTAISLITNTLNKIYFDTHTPRFIATIKKAQNGRITDINKSEVSQYITEYREILKSETFSNKLLLAWLNKITGQGFVEFPSQKENDTGSENVLLKLTGKILYLIKNNKILYSSNGRGFTTNFTPQMERVFSYISVTSDLFSLDSIINKFELVKDAVAMSTINSIINSLINSHSIIQYE